MSAERVTTIYRHFLSWERDESGECPICNLPGDPENEERGAMSMCDGCWRWYHDMCANVSRQNMRSSASWYCISCKSRKTILGPVDVRQVVVPTIQFLVAGDISFEETNGQANERICANYNRCVDIVDNVERLETPAGASAISSLWRSTGEQYTAVDFMISLHRQLGMVRGTLPILFYKYGIDASIDGRQLIAQQLSDDRPVPQAIIGVAPDSTTVAPRHFTVNPGFQFDAMSCLYIPSSGHGLSCARIGMDSANFDRVLPGCVAVVYVRCADKECMNCKDTFPLSSFEHTLCKLCTFSTCTLCSFEMTLYSVALGKPLKCAQCRCLVDRSRSEIRETVVSATRFLRELVRVNPADVSAVDPSTIVVPVERLGNSDMQTDPHVAKSVLQGVTQFRRRHPHLDPLAETSDSPQGTTRLTLYIVAATLLLSGVPQAVQEPVVARNIRRRSTI